MPSIEKMEKAAVDLSRQAEVYLAEGRLSEAVAACELALKIEPNLATACLTLGKVMQVRGEIEQAKQWYESAIELSHFNKTISQSDVLVSSCPIRLNIKSLIPIVCCLFWLL